MPRPFFLFAPGAGAPSSHPWMQRWKERLSTIGEVEAFDYDYMREGRRRPDPLPQLIAAHRAALIETRRDRPVILIGKSMGGRIGCHVSLGGKGGGCCLSSDTRFAAEAIEQNCGTKFCEPWRRQSSLCKARAIRFVRWIFWKAFARK